MRRRFRSFFPGLLTVLLAASGAVASAPCARDCCAPSPAPEAVDTGAAHDHCGGAARDEGRPDPAPEPAHEGCGCHQLSGAEGDRTPAVTGAPAPAPGPVATLAEVVGAAPPATRVVRGSEAERRAGHERAPPLFLLHASFLN